MIETKKEKDMKAKILKMSNCFEGTMNDKEVMETLKIAGTRTIGIRNC